MKVNFFNQPCLLYYGKETRSNLISRTVGFQVFEDVGYFIIIYNEVQHTPEDVYTGVHTL